MTVDLFKTVTGAQLRIHVGQIGQKFQAELGSSAFSLSSSTRKEFAFKNPAGTIVRKTATEVNAPSGTNRTFTDEFGVDTTLLIQLEYTVDVSTLFATAGVWSVWIEVEAPTFTHYGTATEFTVFSVGGV